ncbi:hypothetical protein ULMS_00170 [Patiriisocius marinistellae]|uniref:Secretion system C-terminal sorting domain-containing protein n=1 Tax=Patiriisocius marinistellae TaxID=2494560 RepID=A0A5J4FWT9_9FLAO|nr:T9SS type A sorting domain-containing protein [Patiriisocius marinistellae]GEQ84509.1 hypothetical protein ULMS_00170 [Patiriisocius marinistellae]
MKKFYLLIGLFLFSVSSVVAQYECNNLAYTYYLKQINAGGINQWIFYNDEVTNVTLTCPDDGNGDFNFVTTFCKTGRANVVSNGNGTVSFLNQEFLLDGDSCVQDDNPAFEDAFYSFFTDDLNDEFTFQYGWIHGGEPPGPEFINFLYIYNSSNEYVYFEDYPNGLLDVNNNTLHSISISPNPAEDLVTIAHDNFESTVSQISIINIQGTLITTYEADDNFSQVDVSLLETGIYFLIIETNEGNNFIERFVKK